MIDVAVINQAYGVAVARETLGKGQFKVLAPPLATEPMFIYRHKKHAGLVDKAATVMRELKASGGGMARLCAWMRPRSKRPALRNQDTGAAAQFPGANAGGFILVSVLWIVALLALAAGFFALWIERGFDLAQALQADVQAEVDMRSTQSGLLFLLATQRRTVGGVTMPAALPTAGMSDAEVMRLLQSGAAPGISDDMGGVSILAVGNELRLDDRAYRGQGVASFALQDEAGLISVTPPQRVLLERLLGLLGVAAEQRAPLLAKLEDYIDRDDLHRIHGAERYHYRDAGLPGPANRLLRSPLEARHILGWAEQRQLWDSGLWEHLTTLAPSELPNLNTAPLKVLQTLAGIDAETSRRLIQARQAAPFLDITQANAAAGIALPFDPIDMRLFSGHYLRLTLWHPKASRLRRVHIRLTPSGDFGMPWLIEYTLEIPLHSEFDYLTASPLDTNLSFFQPALSPAPR